jgi:signal transduction histidine kinase
VRPFMSQFFARYGLRAKLALVLIVPAALVVGVLIVLFWRNLNQSFYQQYVEDGLAIASIINQQVAFGERLPEKETLEGFLLRTIEQRPQYVQLALYDPGGRLLAVVGTGKVITHDGAPDEEFFEVIASGQSSYNIESISSPGTKRVLELITPVVIEKKTVAILESYRPLAGAELLAQELIRKVLIVGPAGVGLLVVILFVGINVFIIRPIRRLRSASQQIETGDYQLKLPVSGNDELAMLARTFNQMAQSIDHTVKELQQNREALEAKNKELETFVYTVSHDLKSPVVSLQGLASIILTDQREKLDEEGQHCLERIVANANKMEELIQGLLELSRIGRKAVSIEELELSEAVHGVLETQRELIQRRRVEIVVKQPLPRMGMNRLHLSQILNNLLGNAIKYLGDTASPRVEIGGSAHDGYVQFYVKDNGIGIAPEYHEKVFVIFSRLCDLADVEGTGVGLAIVKKIVDQYKGRIWIESETGRGATFHMRFPLSPSSGKISSKSDNGQSSNGGHSIPEASAVRASGA